MNEYYDNLVTSLSNQTDIDNFINKVSKYAKIKNCFVNDWRNNSDCTSLIESVKSIEILPSKTNDNNYSKMFFFQPHLNFIMAGEFTFDYINFDDSAESKYKPPKDIRLRYQVFNEIESPFTKLNDAIKIKLNLPSHYRGNKMDMKLHQCHLNCHYCFNKFKHCSPEDKLKQYPVCENSNLLLTRNNDGNICAKTYSLDYATKELTKCKGVATCSIQGVLTYNGGFKIIGYVGPNILVSPGLLDQGIFPDMYFESIQDEVELLSADAKQISE